jgi:hypothetical protein
MQKLLNLSNHPHQNWTSAQLAAANTKFAQVIDIPFPAVDPQWDSKGIHRASLSLAKGIIDKYSETEFAIHLMGEQNMSFILLQLLLTRGYSCLASTSARIVEEKEGQKIVRFQFQNFREYKLLRLF